jgi:hypothetical protein
MFNSVDLEKAISGVNLAVSSGDLSCRFVQAWDLLSTLCLRGVISQPQAAVFCDLLEHSRDERKHQLWQLRSTIC